MKKFFSLGRALSKSITLTPKFYHGGHDHDPRIEEYFSDIDDEVSEKSVYDMVQDRMLENTVASPKSPSLEALLKVLVNEDEAMILAKMPQRTTSVKRLAKMNKIEFSEFDKIIDEFAAKGLLFDFYASNGKRYVHFPDLVIGWFEFIAMRNRDNELPMDELDRLFTEYSVTSGMHKYVYLDKEIQLMRTYVREESLNDEQIVKIMDYESVTKTVENAWMVAVQLCTCKHMFYKSDDARNNTKVYQQKVDLPFDYLETCFSFNGVAEALVANGIGREVSVEEAMEIISNCKNDGMVQTCDNTKTPAFLCNCDKDTCKFLNGFGNDVQEVMMTSNFEASFDSEACVKCLSCVKKCPLECFQLNDDKVIEFDSEFCIGCGVCSTLCKGDAIAMLRRDEEVFVPDHMLDRLIRTAFNRGNLHNLVFNDPSRVTHRVIRKVLESFEGTKMSQRLKAIKPLKSIFLKTAVAVGSMFIKIPKDV